MTVKLRKPSRFKNLEDLAETRHCKARGNFVLQLSTLRINTFLKGVTPIRLNYSFYGIQPWPFR